MSLWEMLPIIAVDKIPSEMKNPEVKLRDISTAKGLSQND
jgi:hypothetical protein